VITLLPYPPRCSWLVAFLASVSLTVAAWTSLLLYFVLGGVGVVLGIAAGLFFAACGFLSPQFLSLLYRAYNKVARVITAWAITWVSFVCYFVVFRTMSFFGSRLNVDPDARRKSTWAPVNSVRTICGFEDVSSAGSRGWIGNYLSWCMQSKNLWALCLLPFLFLLSLVEPSSENKTGTVPENIYTLY
jgi:hypothetical protein